MTGFKAAAVALVLAILALTAQADNAQGGGVRKTGVHATAYSASEDISDGHIGQDVQGILNILGKATPPPVAPVASSAPASTPPPTTGPNTIIKTISITASQANTYQPEVLQDGDLTDNGAGDLRYDFGSDTEPPQFDGKFMRFVVIGDWGRQLSDQTVGQCGTPTGIFNGTDGHSTDNELQGGLQQNQTAQLMDQVCGLVGGCQFVVGTGDNFYDCGVDPGSNLRYFTDWFNIYQTSATPHIKGLHWYNTFGNHDMVINGSVEQQIAYSNDIFTVGQTYSQTFTSPDKTVSVKGIFVDSTPFITKYNSPSSGYYQQYYKSHHNASYVAQQAAFVTQELATMPGAYNFVVSHFPIFGTSTQYGIYSGQNETPGTAWPGEFNGWQQLYNAINTGKATTYFNGHDHSMAVGNPAQPAANGTYNGVTSYMTSGAGSWGETGDSCGDPGSYFYSDGGNGGFIIMTVNATVWRADYYTLGSTFSQCTVTQPVGGTAPPTYHPNCALGLPNACCIQGTNCY